MREMTDWEIVETWFDQDEPQAVAAFARLKEQLETAHSALREIGRTYDGVTPIFRKTGTKLLGADAFTYAPDICAALNSARRWPVAYPAGSPKDAT